MKWLPPETAPKSETVLVLLSVPIDTNSVLGWCPESSVDVTVGWWNGYEWNGPWVDEGQADSFGHSPVCNVILHVKGWMPLPEA